MLSIIVETDGPVDIDEGVYQGAAIEDWWTDSDRMYAHLAVGVDEIEASYTLVDDFVRYEIWGTPQFISNTDLIIHHCKWQGDGHSHNVINYVDTCWRIAEDEQ